MGNSERERRLQFLDLTERDEQSLKSLRPLVEKNRAAIVNAFYDHLQRFPETARLLGDHTTVDRIKKLQGSYLMRLTEGNYDEKYFAERFHIGQVHERVGLSPRWYLLTYSHYFNLLTPLIRQFFAQDTARANDAILALEKIFMLDASLAMDAYIASDRYRRLQQLESIVNDSADVIFMLDNEKRFRTWNRAAERIFGWTAEEILGKQLQVLVPPEQLESGEMERIDNELQAHGFCQLETQRLSKHGRRVPVELTLSILRDPKGNPMGRSAILRDITERRRLEEEKLQAERLAVIGAMAAKLTHEIRNPLSSITLNIDLVRDEVEELAKNHPEAGKEAHTLLKSLDSEVRRIQRVTEDYLQFARLPKLQRDRLVFNDLFAQGLSFMQSLFDAMGVVVKTDFEESLPAVDADEGQVWQAVLNLIRNALDAMPTGGTLTLRTFTDGDEVAFSIADTGKGISEAERAQLFKPFFSTKTGGTGLGLPLTQQIIGEHGGRIECESAEGSGAVFTIHMPRAMES